MTAEDWARLGLLGNEIGLQWYQVTHPGSVDPRTSTGQIEVPGARVNFNSNLLIIGLVIAAVVIYSN